MRHVRSRIIDILASTALLVGCAEHPTLSLAAADDPSAAKAAGSQLAAPSTPSAVSAGQNQIDVAWQDNSRDESQFEIHRSTTGPDGVFVLRGSTGANATTYRDGGLTAGTAYCYVIRAVRVKGLTTTFSPLSTAACAVTDQIPPPPPPPAPAPASEAIATAVASSTVLLMWTAVTTSETQFRIERSTDGGALWSVVGTVLSTARSFTDTGVQSERAVCYRVVAFNVSATASPSNTTCTTPPAAPTNLSVTLVDAQSFELTWSDNSVIEDGYEVSAYAIYAPCCGSGGGGDGCPSGYSEGEYPSVRLPAGSTTYRTPVDPNLGACSSVSFEVRATNESGRSTAVSATYTVSE